jgi:uncharacterized protein YbjT (DUF2867 family)
MGDAMTVAVTGASGFVGRHVVRELLEHGYRVRALVRDMERARSVLPRSDGADALTLVTGDAADGRAAAELVGGAGAVIHLVGIIREAEGQTFAKAHVGTTRAVVAAAKGAGANRFLHMSALGVHDDGKTAYQRTKYEAELLVRRSGLDWTIFRPGLIHGADGEFIRMAAGWSRKHTGPGAFLPYFTKKLHGTNPAGGPLGYGDPKVAPVAVEDVARAFVAALSRPESVGEVYNLVGSETLTWPELLAFLRDSVPGGNDALQPRGIPSDLAAHAATAAAKLGLGGLLPFDAGMAIMGGCDSVASLFKVKAHLGLEPAGFRARLRQYVPML